MFILLSPNCIAELFGRPERSLSDRTAYMGGVKILGLFTAGNPPVFTVPYSLLLHTKTSILTPFTPHRKGGLDYAYLASQLRGLLGGVWKRSSIYVILISTTFPPTIFFENYPCVANFLFHKRLWLPHSECYMALNVSSRAPELPVQGWLLRGSVAVADRPVADNESLVVARA